MLIEIFSIMSDEFEYQPKEFTKFTRGLLYCCSAVSFYGSVYIMSNLAISEAEAFSSYDLRKIFIAFIISIAISLFISWSSAITVHKNDKGEIIEITKENSKRFARFIYYSSIIQLLAVAIGILNSF